MRLFYHYLASITEDWWSECELNCRSVTTESKRDCLPEHTYQHSYHVTIIIITVLTPLHLTNIIIIVLRSMARKIANLERKGTFLQEKKIICKNKYKLKIPVLGTISTFPPMLRSLGRSRPCPIINTKNMRNPQQQCLHLSVYVRWEWWWDF